MEHGKKISHFTCRKWIPNDKGGACEQISVFLGIRAVQMVLMKSVGGQPVPCDGCGV